MSGPRWNPQRVRAQGYSLVELLVAIVILSILTAFLLPAVQQSRAAARRLACVNNLKQIGLALNSYVSAHGYYPAINSPSSYQGGSPVSAHAYSPFARMLAELEQRALYHSTNFTKPAAFPQALISNQTVMMTEIGLFLCPSDVRSPVPGYGRTSYRFNVGSTPWWAPGPQAPDSYSGPFTVHRFYRPADMRDGLSQTVAASERLQGDWTKHVFGPGDYLLIAGDNTKSRTGPDWALSVCDVQREGKDHESRSGESWFLSGYHFSCYNHCAVPNAPLYDCSFIEHSGDMHNRSIHQGVFTARSHHAGGVNALALDGNVRFVRSGIERATWRAIGTRSGGEVVVLP